ncbi:isochorismate synthase [Brunnivagina elsteri]|uniref:isochorismate synthase n=1 Tax=Brunnivagina elsteri CCALA 953 TaxID=987040 RepID=A0A2A2TPI7_9CYAN|nr:isochorismate synthase [Calothrix elsteri]PAX60274.1 isochorismate synthase [Calothrix elsteri CCALA 953]
MTVSQCLPDFLVYNKEIYEFLLAVREKCIRNNYTKIASVSLEINLVDPLVLLAKLAQQHQVSFYWENQANKESIVAIDAVAKLEVSGKERFDKAEKFIKDCLSNIVEFGWDKVEFSQPHFYCGFGFFEDNLQQDYPFAASTIFLPSWQVAVKDKRCRLVANLVVNADTNINVILQVLWTKIEIIQSLAYYSSNTASTYDNSQRRFNKESIANPEKFKNSVKSALKSIESNRFSKIVLADILDIRSATIFNLFKSLHNLRQLHPNCCIFSISNGKGQNFIGASPERLISIHKQQLITDALAGSAPRGKTPQEDSANANLLLNSEKERHEHSLVIDFITQQLSKLGLLPQILAPRLRQLSNIQHLWTPIQATVPSNVHPLQIVAQLHPTPAVAGCDRDLACAEIRRYESFERGLYAAPLGWVDASGNCEFIVGIRSALIDGDKARLYAGAGIVAGSDPNKELAEIQLKFQALLKALI